MHAVDRVIDLIYEGAADAAAWPDAMSALCDLVGGDHGVALVQGAERTEFPFVASARVDAANLARFMGSAADGIDMLQSFRAQQAFDFDAVIPREMFLRSEFFHEVIRPMGGYRALMTVPLRRDGFDSYVAICRTPREPEFGAAEAAVIDRIAPHVERAMRTHLAIDGMARKLDAALGAFDRLCAGVAVVDRELRPLVLNRRARQIVEAGDGLVLSGRSLTGGSATDTGWLGRLVQRAAADDPRVAGSYSMRLPRPAAGRAWTVTASALARDGGMPAGLVLLLLEEAAPRTADLAPLLQSEFGLSPREAALAAALAGGIDLAGAAHALGIAVGTARTHLKAVFAKTGTHRQAELVALLARLNRFRG
jgi:DNA-binding CsgD family transcriptional regulator/PAS domain-containing protein